MALIPSPSEPFIDASGRVTQRWYNFLADRGSDGDPIFVEVTEPVDYVDFIVPAAYRRHEFHFANVVSNYEVDGDNGSLLTLYVGKDGTVYEGSSYPDYQSAGMVNWPGEPNEDFASPYDLGVPQTLTRGFRVSGDHGGSYRMGTSGSVFVTSPGSLGGEDVDTHYWAFSHHAFTGGAAGQSAKEAWQGGGFWFSGDPLATPFDWSSITIWAGAFQGATGTAMNRFRFRMNGGSDATSDAQIVGGYFECRPRGRIRG